MLLIFSASTVAKPCISSLSAASGRPGAILSENTWAETKENIIFLTEQEVKALFSNFELIQFSEIEKDATIASGEKKHWHVYDIIAQKKIFSKDCLTEL